MLGVINTLPICAVTKRLIECLLWDAAMSPAVSADFGDASPNHDRALKSIVFAADDSAEEPIPDAVEAALHRRGPFGCLGLDGACGNSERLNALVQK